MGAEVFHTLKGVLKKRGYSTAVGDEGGFAPNLKSNEEALEVVMEAITLAGYKPGEQIGIALDPGVQRVLRQGQEASTSSRNRTRASGPPSRWWSSGRTGSASIRSSRLKTAWPKTIGTAGSCLPTRSAARSSWSATICLSPTRERLQMGIERGVANSILVKVNQIGTLTETLDAMATGGQGGLHCIASHRSGETEDAFIADLAVATNAGQIKTGSASRTDRIAKYNQLLRIEEELGASAKFAGRKAFKQ